MGRLKKKAEEYFGLFKDTYKSWNDREPFNNSIIIAYYTIFSLPGLLVIMINLAGVAFGKEQVTKQLTDQIGGMIGGDTAKDVALMIGKVSESKDTVISSILGVATLIFGATGVFYQLQQILNKIWEVEPKSKQKILKLIKDRIFSFGLILAIGFLLLVSLILSSVLTVLSNWITGHFSESLAIVFKVFDVVISLGVITLLFSAIYKMLPDVKIKWKDVWAGALIASVFFVIAKFALGVYFGKSDPGSAYGAAGSVILIMLWVSYSGLILLYGAEFTRVYVERYGEPVKPSGFAVLTHGENDNGSIVNRKKGKETSQKSDQEVHQQETSK